MLFYNDKLSAAIHWDLNLFVSEDRVAGDDRDVVGIAVAEPVDVLEVIAWVGSSQHSIARTRRARWQFTQVDSVLNIVQTLHVVRRWRTGAAGREQWVEIQTLHTFNRQYN